MRGRSIENIQDKKGMKKMNIDFTTLAIVSVLTTLSTECIKILMNKNDMNYVSNIIASIMSAIISFVIVIVRPLVMGTATLNAELIYNGISVAFFGVLMATLSFDKVKQAIEKIK